MRPIAEYTIVEASPVAATLRAAADLQTDNSLMWLPSNQANPRGGAGVGYFQAHNRSSATVSAGLGFRLVNSAWVAGQWTQTSGVFTDDTTDAQDAGTNDFALETTTNNDGFIVAARQPFNAISFDVSTAGLTGAPVVDFAYSNLAGTGWTTLVATNFFDAPEALWPLGIQEIVWVPPTDWGKVTAINTIPVGYYAIRVRKTTAQTGTAALATAMEVWRVLFLTEGLADNASLTFNLTPSELYVQDVSGAAPYLTSITNLQSRVTALIRER